MTHRIQAPPLKQGDFLSRLLSSCFAAFWLILLFSVSNVQAATPAGTQISNSAAATYKDSAGIDRTVTSNTVITQVQQVASVTLDTDLSYLVNPGGEVSYPVTLTNTGNGSDSFLLATTSNSGGFTLGSVLFYADNNGDGIADNNTPITSTPVLAAGQVFYFVASATAPLTATTGQINTLVITGTSVFNSLVKDIVTETTTITDNAVINVTKSMSATTGAAGSGTYTVALAYRNEGNKTATAVTLTDALPVGMTYATGSGQWSVTGATLLSDGTALDGTSPTIDYQYDSATNKITAIINSVAIGQAGTLTFKVNIASATLPGTLLNTATYAYNDGVAVVPTKNSNTVDFKVTSTDGVTFVGPATPTASAPESGTVAFDNVLTNTGNATDTFDIAIDSNSFPAGSSYTLYQPGGLVPLVDSNSNGTPDTGPVIKGATYTVVLKVTLPTNVPLTPAGPYVITKTATSTNDPTKKATATDTLTAVNQNSVDLTNNTALTAGTDLGEGVFATGETASVVTNIAAAGATTRFTLYANNGAGGADSYDLSAWANGAASTVLPTGWTVVFKDASGNIITNTGIIAANGNKLIYADVTTPANAVVATTDIYFRVLSPTTASTDVIHDAVTISGVRSASLIAPNTSQLAPGATVIYPHTLTNTGNEAEDFTLTVASKPGFTSIVYIDVNNNGVIDATDTVVNTADAIADITALPAKGITHLLVKVTADSGTNVGTVDTTTLTATFALATINTVAAPSPVTVIDTTTVASGNVVLLKEQALDTACDGETVFSTANIGTGAVPGVCIVYRITATNNGTADVTNVVISDNTPAFTKYNSASATAATVPVTTVTAPVTGSTGTISAPIGTLTPSASSVLTFGVKID